MCHDRVCKGIVTNVKANRLSKEVVLLMSLICDHRHSLHDIASNLINILPFYLCEFTFLQLIFFFFPSDFYFHLVDGDFVSKDLTSSTRLLATKNVPTVIHFYDGG